MVIPEIITKKDFKSLQKSLKKMDNGWVEKLVVRIKENHQDTEYSDINEQKVYNVFNGRLSSGNWRITVYKEARGLLLKFIQELKSAKAAV